MELHIDIETYCEVSLPKCGLYRYVSDSSFEIMLLAYSFGIHDPVKVVDLYSGDKLPKEFISAIKDTSCTLHAHNAAFERLSLTKYFSASIGRNRAIELLDIRRWRCSMAKAAICSLPLGLDMLGQALGIERKKLATEGAKLVKLFATPGKKGVRNTPDTHPEEYARYKAYVKRDVEAEIDIAYILAGYNVGHKELAIYQLDQRINDRGVCVDRRLAGGANSLDEIVTDKHRARLSELMGLENPGSPKQIKDWLYKHTGKQYKSLNKAVIPNILEELTDPKVKELFKESRKLTRNSNAKFNKVLDYATEDNRINGLFQYAGATSTGRWAGRGVQLQNLRRNNVEPLDLIRELVKRGDLDTLELIFDDIPDVLSQLIRTVLIAPKGYKLVVADYSAIEARVIAWLAREKWRLDVFNSHGKIYEASASMMFNVPIEAVTPELRAKGKIAELALGFGGSVNAMLAMAGANSGILPEEFQTIVNLWRAKSRRIVALWYELDRCAIHTVKTGRPSVTGAQFERIGFEMDKNNLTILLPSGRKLYYIDAHLGTNRFGGESVCYYGVSSGQWVEMETYGGKLAENITQATARDLLAEAMLRIDAAGKEIVLHVHDEVATLSRADDITDTTLTDLYALMCNGAAWTRGLPVGADGFISEYYKK